MGKETKHRVGAWVWLPLVAAVCAVAMGEPAVAQVETQVVVTIKVATGAPLEIQTEVRLTAQGTSMRLQEITQGNGQAIFRGVPRGLYHAEVTVPGYEPAREEVAVEQGALVTRVFIHLRPVSATSNEFGIQPTSGPTELSPKARKEADLGLEALRANNLKEAQQRLERALKMAPGDPYVNYLVGLLYFRQNRLEQAKTHLQKATSLYAQHAPSQAAFGAVLYRTGDNAGAIRALEQALVLDPGTWETHAAIAGAYYRDQQWEKAQAHAQRAIELAKTPLPDMELLQGMARAVLGKREEAITQLEAFLKAYPQHPGAEAARKVLERMRAQTTATPPTSGSEPALPTAPAVAAPVPLPAGGDWAPPDVDESAPPVAADVGCSLPEVLQAAGERVLLLSQNLENVGATERIEHAELDGAGIARVVDARTFNYVVSIREVRPGHLSVEENRDRPTSPESFPTRMFTSGLAALALIFHPYYRDDFEMSCEGLGQWQGQPVWQVRFRQRDDRLSRIRVYQTEKGRFPVGLKGRAWIAANTFQMVRLETDLVKPVPEATLQREHLTIDYRPVEFLTRKLRLWLPASAELHAHLRGHRYRVQHKFTEFVVFAVDTRQQIQQIQPKEP